MSRWAIVAGYDRGAPGFARHADARVYRYLAAPLAEALDGVEGRVLDVATGTGALGRRLDDVVGVDLSGGQLTQNPLCRRVRADAVKLPFPRDAFAAAASAFGINQPARPGAVVSEMARVASVVGLLTWARPAEPYIPKEVVLGVIERHAGAPRPPAARIVSERTDAVGSEHAIRRLLREAGLEREVATVRFEVPWPGAEVFVDYRLSLMDTSSFVPDPDAVRAEAAEALRTLPPESLAWRPRLVLGVGRAEEGSGR